MSLIAQENLQKIQISQGYSNCSIAVIDCNAAIVTDIKIAEILREYKVEVLYLEKSPDIKLLKDQKEYSLMQGFIGGAMARIENKMMIFGDLKKIDEQGKIREFLQNRQLEIIDFKDFDVIDYGGIIVI